MNKRLPIAFSMLLSISATLTQASAQAGYRTVIDKELGSFYQNPGSTPWTAYGMFVGSPVTLDPAAYRVLMGHFDKFASEESLSTHSFPYAEFAAYDAAERAAGRPGLFISATYGGKKRPVYFPWSMGLKNGVPTAPQSQWQRAVNVEDPRFVHFWLNHYVQALMSKYQKWGTFGPNLGFQIDQCAFVYSLYGVVNDSNQWVAGITWDFPFPQNQDDYESGIESFFSQVHNLAPNVVVMANLGSQANPSHFSTIFANVPGILMENLYGWASFDIPYVRNQWYTQNFQYLPWLGSQNKIELMRALVPSADSNGLITSFVTYSLFKGANSFFSPGYDTGYALNPSSWAGMRAQLGSPTGTMTSSAPSSTGVAYRMYSRNFEGGTVYLNWTGATQTIALNPLISYYDPNGNLLSSHSVKVADAAGTYVTMRPNALTAPEISPRGPNAFASPLRVTIATSVTGGTIRYTLNGTSPTISSPIYTSPIVLTSSATVKARVFYGTHSSYTSAASYTIASGTPTVGFVLQSDSGLAGPYYPVVSLNAVPSGQVTVDYSVSNGSPSSGSYTFLPGMQYGILPVTTGSSGTATVSITSVAGAGRNANQVLHYTIK